MPTKMGSSAGPRARTRPRRPLTPLRSAEELRTKMASRARLTPPTLPDQPEAELKPLFYDRPITPITPPGRMTEAVEDLPTILGSWAPRRPQRPTSESFAPFL